EYASAGGYQQTRAMMCIASGGLFGLGAGNGWLKSVFAADTDRVFAFLCEEWGLIIGLCAVAVIVILAVFTVRSAKVGRSSFYTIAACAAVAILTIQTILNVFGTMDLLPLTGVTFPFLSNGGSSMLASWGLIAFLKAADTRQNASFAVRTAKAEEVEPLE
ncbi:MAG: FtsW/RodA/SpoVE family cell cycle protein, partial [Oscillospiraceae bacterium]